MPNIHIDIYYFTVDYRSTFWQQHYQTSCSKTIMKMGIIAYAKHFYDYFRANYGLLTAHILFLLHFRLNRTRTKEQPTKWSATNRVWKRRRCVELQPGRRSIECGDFEGEAWRRVQPQLSPTTLPSIILARDIVSGTLSRAKQTKTDRTPNSRIPI